MTNKIKTQPVIEPVTLNEVRAHMGITANDDNARDSIITSRIIAARLTAEEYTSRKFITQTWYTYADKFADNISLLVDVQSVTSIKYVDINGVTQTLSPSIYYVDLVSNQIALAYNKTWPDTYAQPNSVIIEYVCGYGLASAVPEPIKEAIKIIVSQWESYQASIEGARVSTLPYSALQLLNPYIDMRGYF